MRVQIHELRVQIHKLRVQIYKLRVQIHELRVQISSNINEVIRSVLNFFFFFHDKILHALKAPKSTKNYKNTTKRKHKNANKGTKIKNELKKYLSGKK